MPPYFLEGTEFITIGNGFRAKSNLRIEAYWEDHKEAPPYIRIGNGVCFNYDVHIGAVYGIVIGDDVLIGSHVLITDHNHGDSSNSVPSKKYGGIAAVFSPTAANPRLLAFHAIFALILRNHISTCLLNTNERNRHMPFSSFIIPLFNIRIRLFLQNTECAILYFSDTGYNTHFHLQARNLSPI